MITLYISVRRKVPVPSHNSNQSTVSEYGSSVLIPCDVNICDHTNRAIDSTLRHVIKLSLDRSWDFQQTTLKCALGWLFRLIWNCCQLWDLQTVDRLLPQSTKSFRCVKSLCWINTSRENSRFTFKISQTRSPTIAHESHGSPPCYHSLVSSIMNNKPLYVLLGECRQKVRFESQK